MITKTICLIFFTIAAVKGAFPDDPKPCKYAETKCFEKMFNFIAKEKPSGYADINLAAFDPLKMDKLHVKPGSSSPVNVDLMLTNVSLLGFSTSKFLGMQGFDKEIATKHEIVYNPHHIYLIGTYKVSGKVLVLPITGSGKFNITLVNPRVSISWNGVPVEKNGEAYLKLEKYFVDVTPENLILYFENLFNDKILSDNMNLFLNENWKEVYPEIRTPIGKALASATKQRLQNVFEKYPYHKMFAE
ncbi:protein takeout-like isoform X2 [Haematobia irritans]|uniref:protein takeout-like isoform X2 n=1 Tax=Haematobia irritans TaxID=7368 RepID=UPI003F501927